MQIQQLEQSVLEVGTSKLFLHIINGIDDYLPLYIK